MEINKERDRIGHVFQDKYKSESICNDVHLQQVIRYIHNNLIEAKITKSLDQYKWSSYNEYININKNDIVTEGQKDFVLNYFNKDIKRFITFHHKEDIDRYDDREDIRTNLIDSYERLMQFIAKHLNDKFYLEKDQRIRLRDKIFREVISKIL